MRERDSIVPFAVALTLSALLHVVALRACRPLPSAAPRIQTRLGRTSVRLALVAPRPAPREKVLPEKSPEEESMPEAPRPPPVSPPPRLAERRPGPLPAPERPLLQKPEKRPPAPEKKAERNPAKPKPAPAPAEPATAVAAPQPIGVRAEKAVPTRAIRPVYPVLSRRRGEEGTVRIAVRVAASGRPLDVRLLRSSGHARLDKAALKAVRKARFVPPKRNGRPIESKTELDVLFRLTEKRATNR